MCAGLQVKEDKELRAQLDKIEKLLLTGSGSGSSSASTSSTSSKSSKISEKVRVVLSIPLPSSCFHIHKPYKNVMYVLLLKYIFGTCLLSRVGPF